MRRNVHRLACLLTLYISLLWPALATPTQPEMYILEVALDKNILSDAFLIYHDGRNTYIPLEDLATMLQFPLTVDAQGNADGWFISPERTLTLNLDRQEIFIQGARQPFSKDHVRMLDDRLHVSTTTLEHWFPLSFNYIIASQRLIITPTEPLPIQQAWQRQQQRTSYAHQERPDYPLTKLPYRMFTYPSVDVTLSPEYDDRRAGFGGEFNLLATGDLAYLTGELFASGNETGLTDIQLALGRVSPQRDLLGPLAASEFRIGDINSRELPLIADNTTGRGAFISNFPLERVREFDRITLRGILRPDWEVELYRNDILLDFQVGNATGEYIFDDVPLVVGENIVRLVFYGPFGEKEERIERYVIGADQVKPGEQLYHLAVIEHERDLLQVNEFPDFEGTRGEPRVIAEYAYGVNERLSLFSNFAHIPLENTRARSYLSGGVNSNLWGFFLRGSVASDIAEGGTSYSLAAQRRIQDTSLSLEYERFINFISEATETTFDPLTSRLRGIIEGRLPGLDFLQLTSSLITEYREFRSNRANTDLTHRLSLPLGSTFLSHTLRYSENSFDTGSASFTNGELLVNLRQSGLSLRGTSAYALDPAELTGISLTSDYDLSPTMLLRGSISHELGEQSLTRYGLGLTEELAHMRINTTAEYEDTGNLRILLSLSFNLSHDPTESRYRMYPDQYARYGKLSASIFHDRDGDGMQSDADTPLEHARIRVNQARSRGHSNQNGMVFHPQLETAQQTQLSVDLASIDDPFLVPLEQGHAVIARPGVTAELAFPMVMTGEIDGITYLERSGTQTEAANVMLELTDLEGNIIATTTSGYDGFYLFQSIRPGKYHVQVSPDQLARTAMQATPSETLTISHDGTVISGQDMVLKSLQNK